ncbi:hypothetical protein TRIUR3_18331 [Triticum urartu]|uniref:Pterin-binding domain-containing protein n=1 Tax=Triticum urartu TaxID=4572 RepID=M8A548_TRIUA|nr:hypothetical protein TRIUR3_18331 [Triticum urartu]
MAVLISSVASKALALYTPGISRHRRSTVSFASAHRPRILAMNFWGANHNLPIRRATQIPAAVPGPESLPRVNLPMSNMPSWLCGSLRMTLVVGAVLVAIPIYRKIRALEDKVEKTAEVAVEVIDTVAEAAEKVAGEVAEAFPENEGLKEAASRIKTVADAIEEDAELAEALIHKVDELTKEVDSVVGPIIDVVMKESGERGVVDEEPKSKESDNI